MEKLKSVLSYEGYLIERIEFTINKNFKPDSGQVEIEFSLGCEFKKEEDVFQVSLECIIFEDAERKNKPFSLDIVITGFYEFDADLSDEIQYKMLKINATAILYPYLRSFVTTVTGNAGFTPLILPLINVYEFLKSAAKEKEE